MRRDVACILEGGVGVGGRGGGKPHMAQAGIPDASRMADAMAAAPGLVGVMVGGA